MAGTTDLTRLLVAIANLDHTAAADLLNAAPSLATAKAEQRIIIELPGIGTA